MSLPLPELQRAFAAALFSDDIRIAQEVIADGIDAEDRLRVYRNTAFSVLTDALRLTYPALNRIVGVEFFDATAAAFIRAHPPRSGYLTAYGGAFADFLAAFAPAAAIAYLPDVARFEWALNVAANAFDQPALDPHALTALPATEHSAVCFTPHGSLCLLELTYPADAIADAVHARDDAAMAAIDLASGPVRLLVHRGPDGVEARRLSADAWRFTARLCDGVSLEKALAAAPALDVPALLAEHLARGRFTAFHIVDKEESS